MSLNFTSLNTQSVITKNEIKQRMETMLRAAITFFILALVAFFVGANGIAGISMEIGKLLLGVFLVLALISLLASFTSGRKSQRLP